MKAYLEILRPHQWLKNLMLLFPPFLGGTLNSVGSPVDVILPILSFSFGASSIYIINDLADVSFDINHPTKCQRPIPAGIITPDAAKGISVALAIGALVSGYWISTGFLMLMLAYLIISLSYSWRLKNIPVVELFCVSSGFVLRLFAGGEAYRVEISDWLFLSVFLLSLYLVCGKRLCELRHEGGQSPNSVRPVLALYPDGFLDGTMFICGGAALVTYAMYVISHQNNFLLIPVCCFGLLSYLMRVLSGKGGDPTRALLKDPVLFIVGIIWVILEGWHVYY